MYCRGLNDYKYYGLIPPSIAEVPCTSNTPQNLLVLIWALQYSLGKPPCAYRSQGHDMATTFKGLWVPVSKRDNAPKGRMLRLSASVVPWYR